MARYKLTSKGKVPLTEAEEIARDIEETKWAVIQAEREAENVLQETKKQERQKNPFAKLTFQEAESKIDKETTIAGLKILMKDLTKLVLSRI